MNSAIHLMNLEADFFPVSSPDENTDQLTSFLQSSEALSIGPVKLYLDSYPQKLWDSKYVLFLAAKFVVISYAAIENWCKQWVHFAWGGCELNGSTMAWCIWFPKRATINSSLHIHCVPHVKRWNLIPCPWVWAGIIQCLLWPIECDRNDVWRLQSYHKESWNFFLGLLESLLLVVLTQCVSYLPYWKGHVERPHREDRWRE